MSDNYFITELLQLKDPNITFSKEISTVKKKGIVYSLISGNLTPEVTHCPHCGCLKSGSNIIKYGFKSSDIKLLHLNGNPTILRLSKQRFYCKECHRTFSAASDIVDRNCYISKHVKRKILNLLTLKISEKDIAEICNVSHSTVSRAVDNNYDYFKPDYRHLPEHLLFDEFKSTRDAKGAMSFIFVDADTHKIIDIVENRKLYFLKRYFNKFSKKALANVKTVCIDMYSPYISLIKDMFPNAEIIIDKFHIVQMLSRALNKTRIDTMSSLNTSSLEYKRLKKYWKLLLKNQQDLDAVNFHHTVHFKSFMSDRTIAEDSISVSPVLKNSYKAYQALLFDINNGDAKAFKNDLNYFLTSDISNHMKKSINSIIKSSSYVENSFNYSYTNGAIEGINNYIKSLKRIAFGYKSFFHFKNRILISRNLISPKKYAR